MNGTLYVCFYFHYRLESTKNVADIKLAQHLDYESNIEYTLIVRVQNKYQLAAETVVNIKVLDVNDNIPVFREMEKGSVLENEPPGVPVMQVRAIDADGTSAHNQVGDFIFFFIHVSHKDRKINFEINFCYIWRMFISRYFEIFYLKKLCFSYERCNYKILLYK